MAPTTPTRSPRPDGSCNSFVAAVIAVAVACLLPTAVRADEPPKAEKVRILFVANSYSHWNHLPRLLEAFVAAGQKRDAEVMPFTSAGAPLSWHLKDGRAMKWLTGDTKDFVAGAERGVAKVREQIAKDPDKGEGYPGSYKITLKDQLREKEIESARAKDPRWDYVFLLFFTDDYAADDGEITQRVKTFADAARERKVVPIVWLPWGGTEDLKRYAPIARELKVKLVPTSFAEQLHKSGKLAATTPVRWGGGHPDARTTYLYACMFYAAMFDKSPEGLPVFKLRGYGEKDANVELTPEEAARLQKSAWQAVQAYRELEAALPNPGGKK